MGFRMGIGAPERIRTSDLCLRRAALYPAEPDIARISGGFDALIVSKKPQNVHFIHGLCDQSVTGSGNKGT